ncbi:MAG: class D sortase [Thermoanaerobaculia bacterium]
MAASRVLRRVEIALLVIGLSLLGVALGATALRWNFQAEQERAFERVMATSQVASAANDLESVSPPSETAAEVVGEPSIPAAPGKTEEAVESLGKEVPVAVVPESPKPQRLAEDKPKKASRPVPPPADALDPNLLGRLVIPRLAFSAFVLEGEDESTLERAVGFLPGTARPGEGGNTGLAAHRDTFFRPLEGIQVDDRIRLEVPPHTYEYRVDSVRIVEPSEVSVLDFTGTEELTLVTCYPFRYIGPAPDRFIVKATRVQ